MKYVIDYYEKEDSLTCVSSYPTRRMRIISSLEEINTLKVHTLISVYELGKEILVEERLLEVEEVVKKTIHKQYIEGVEVSG